MCFIGEINKQQKNVENSNLLENILGDTQCRKNKIELE